MAKILLIEDDAVVRETVAQILEDAGHAVITAENGRAGVATFRREKPHLVITDIIMPEQEGIQTLIEIRRTSPQAKVIVMSGGGRVGNKNFLHIAAKLGAAAVVTKPFDPDEFLGSITDVLEGDEGGPSILGA